MAQWTEPKTMVQGAAALSADWNTYIRDNSQYLKNSADVVDEQLPTINQQIQALEDRIQVLTQAEYDEITPNPETIYIIVG